MTVEIGKAKERPYIFDLGWSWPGSDTVELDRVHGELTEFHDHSKIFDFGDVELALLKLQVEVEFSHSLKDTTSSFGVGLWVGGGDEKIIHVHR